MKPIDVIIPARDEEHTIKKVIRPFLGTPGIGSVWVAVDADTTDGTAYRSAICGANVIITTARGKGQVIRYALERVTTDQVILCDADLTGLTSTHVEDLMGTDHRIGVPDLPLHDIFESDAVRERPEWFNGIIHTWGWVSGQRCVPTAILRTLDLHGYLTEVQINAATDKAGIPTKLVPLQGLRSPFLMSPRRILEMERDRKWGIEHGILMGKE